MHDSVVSTPRSRRCTSANRLKESWKLFYEIVGDAVGRGGAGKVYHVKPISGNAPQERKISMPALSKNGDFGTHCELVNEIPHEKQLAVKIIRRFRCGRDSIDKIRNEINLIKALQPFRPHDSNHTVPDAIAPYLISVHEDPTQVAIVMEFAKGGSLFDLFRLNSSSQLIAPSGDDTPPSYRVLPSSRIPEVYVSSVLARITDALVYMHEIANIVHLDIKAENILLREPYPSPDVFITDFGLASILSQTKPHKELAGTPDYTAPEVISYDPVSFATDMWSVGVLVYFMLTGVSPFLAETKPLTLSNITQMKIDYPPHLFHNASSAALDFIKALIIRNPRARLSASQCNKHQWLQQHRPQKTSPPPIEEAERNRNSESEEEMAGCDAESTGSSSSDESSTSSDSCSYSQSPSRKRIALAHSSSASDQENVDIAIVTTTSKVLDDHTKSTTVTTTGDGVIAEVGSRKKVLSNEDGSKEQSPSSPLGCLPCLSLPSNRLSSRPHRLILCSIPAAVAMTTNSGESASAARENASQVD